MNSLLRSAVLSSTALLAFATAAAAQTAPATPPVATPDGCRELVTFLEGRGTAQPASPVTLDQARGFQSANDAAGCRDAATRIQAARITLPAPLLAVVQAPDAQPAQGAQVVVQQTAPTISVEQARPQVTVSQAQPEIIVRQPAPSVTVDIPQPEIIVRMPRPDVQVSQARPEVTVNQAQPQVQVQPAQPQVNLAGVNQQPQVRYERAEPRVVVNQGQGQPQIRVEQMGAGAASSTPDQTAATAPQSAEESARLTRERIGIIAVPITPPATNTPKRSVSVGSLPDMMVYTARGERLGEVERLVLDPSDNQRYLVVEHGGFLGLGQSKTALPLSRMMMQGDRLVVSGMTEAEFDAMARWSTRLPNAKPVDVKESVELTVRG